MLSPLSVDYWLRYGQRYGMYHESLGTIAGGGTRRVIEGNAVCDAPIKTSFSLGCTGIYVCARDMRAPVAHDRDFPMVCNVVLLRNEVSRVCPSWQNEVLPRRGNRGTFDIAVSVPVLYLIKHPVICCRYVCICTLPSPPSPPSRTHQHTPSPHQPP